MRWGTLLAAAVIRSAGCGGPEENPCPAQEWRCESTVLEVCAQTYPDGNLAWIRATDCADEGKTCATAPPGCY